MLGVGEIGVIPQLHLTKLTVLTGDAGWLSLFLSSEWRIYKSRSQQMLQRLIEMVTFCMLSQNILAFVLEAEHNRAPSRLLMLKPMVQLLIEMVI